jgi:hypothetical protein
MLPTWHGAWLIADFSGLALGITLIGWERNGALSRKAPLLERDAANLEAGERE